MTDIHINVFDIFAIIGAALILFGFYRTSIGKWTGKSFWYEMDNFIGAILVGFYQLHHHATISVVINVIWGIVAFRGLTPYAERRIRQANERRKARKK